MNVVVRRAVSCAFVAAALSAPAQEPAPIAVYFGSPTAVNGAGSVPAASAAFGAYARVMLAPGLESPFHPENGFVAALVAATPQTDFYGTVDLSILGGPALSYPQIAATLVQWAGLGVAGVCFDGFGYERGVTRSRQNVAVDLAHTLGLKASAAPTNPADAFSAAYAPTNAAGGGNPTSAATHLGADDRCVVPGFAVALGAFEPDADFFARAGAARAGRDAVGAAIDAVAVAGATFLQTQCDYAWWVAAASGFDGFGWVEPSAGIGTDALPYRTRPAAGPLASTPSEFVLDAAGRRAYGLGATGQFRVGLPQRTGAFLPATVLGPGAAPLGTTLVLAFSAPGAGGAAYAAAVAGATAPGVPLGDGRLFPLAGDGLFLASLSGDAALGGFAGVLDAGGSAPASVAIPNVPALSGLTIQVAFAVFDPNEPSLVGVFSAAHAATVP